MRPDGAGDAQHILKVGAAVLVRRRPYRNENDLAMGHGGHRIGGKAKPPLGAIGPHDGLQARLVDGNFTALEALDFRCVDVDAYHLVAHFREAGACYQAYIAGAKNRYFHRKLIP